MNEPMTRYDEVPRIFNNIELKQWLRQSGSRSRRRELLVKLKDDLYRLEMSKHMVRQALMQLATKPYVILDRRFVNRLSSCHGKMQSSLHDKNLQKMSHDSQQNSTQFHKKRWKEKYRDEQKRNKENVRETKEHQSKSLKDIVQHAENIADDNIRLDVSAAVGTASSAVTVDVNKNYETGIRKRSSFKKKSSGSVVLNSEKVGGKDSNIESGANSTNEDIAVEKSSIKMTLLERKHDLLNRLAQDSAHESGNEDFPSESKIVQVKDESTSARKRSISLNQECSLLENESSEMCMLNSNRKLKRQRLDPKSNTDFSKDDTVCTKKRKQNKTEQTEINQSLTSKPKSLNMLKQKCTYESKDNNFFCKRDVNSSSIVTTSKLKTCSEASSSSSKTYTQTSHIDSQLSVKQECGQLPRIPVKIDTSQIKINLKSIDRQRNSQFTKINIKTEVDKNIDSEFPDENVLPKQIKNETNTSLVKNLTFNNTEIFNHTLLLGDELDQKNNVIKKRKRKKIKKYMKSEQEIYMIVKRELKRKRKYKQKQKRKNRLKQKMHDYFHGFNSPNTSENEEENKIITSKYLQKLSLISASSSDSNTCVERSCTLHRITTKKIEYINEENKLTSRKYKIVNILEEVEEESEIPSKIQHFESSLPAINLENVNKNDICIGNSKESVSSLIETYIEENMSKEDMHILHSCQNIEKEMYISSEEMEEVNIQNIIQNPQKNQKLCDSEDSGLIEEDSNMQENITSNLELSFMSTILSNVEEKNVLLTNNDNTTNVVKTMAVERISTTVSKSEKDISENKCTVNEAFSMPIIETSIPPKKSRTNTNNNQSDDDNISDIEIEIKIKPKSKSQPISLKTKTWLNSLKKNPEVLGELFQMNIKAPYEKTIHEIKNKENNTSEELLDINKNVTTASTEIALNTQEVVCDSNCTIKDNENRSLQQQNDITLNEDRNVMEHNQAETNECISCGECIPSVEEKMQAIVENNPISTKSIHDTSDLEKQLPKTSSDEKRKIDEQILNENHVGVKNQSSTNLGSQCETPSSTNSNTFVTLDSACPVSSQLPSGLPPSNSFLPKTDPPPPNDDIYLNFKDYFTKLDTVTKNILSNTIHCRNFIKLKELSTNQIQCMAMSMQEIIDDLYQLAILLNMTEFNSVINFLNNMHIVDQQISLSEYRHYIRILKLLIKDDAHHELNSNASSRNVNQQFSAMPNPNIPLSGMSYSNPTKPNINQPQFFMNTGNAPLISHPKQPIPNVSHQYDVPSMPHSGMSMSNVNQQKPSENMNYVMVNVPVDTSNMKNPSMQQSFINLNNVPHILPDASTSHINMRPCGLTNQGNMNVPPTIDKRNSHTTQKNITNSTATVAANMQQGNQMHSQKPFQVNSGTTVSQPSTTNQNIPLNTRQIIQNVTLVGATTTISNNPTTYLNTNMASEYSSINLQAQNPQIPSEKTQFLPHMNSSQQNFVRPTLQQQNLHHPFKEYMQQQNFANPTQQQQNLFRNCAPQQNLTKPTLQQQTFKNQSSQRNTTNLTMQQQNLRQNPKNHVPQRQNLRNPMQQQNPFRNNSLQQNTANPLTNSYMPRQNITDVTMQQQIRNHSSQQNIANLTMPQQNLRQNPFKNNSPQQTTANPLSNNIPWQNVADVTMQHQQIRNHSPQKNLTDPNLQQQNFTNLLHQQMLQNCSMEMKKNTRPVNMPNNIPHNQMQPSVPHKRLEIPQSQNRDAMANNTSSSNLLQDIHQGSSCNILENLLDTVTKISVSQEPKISQKSHKKVKCNAPSQKGKTALFTAKTTLASLQVNDMVDYDFDLDILTDIQKLVLHKQLLWYFDMTKYPCKPQLLKEMKPEQKSLMYFWKSLDIYININIYNQFNMAEKHTKEKSQDNISQNMQKEKMHPSLDKLSKNQSKQNNYNNPSFDKSLENQFLEKNTDPNISMNSNSTTIGHNLSMGTQNKELFFTSMPVPVIIREQSPEIVELQKQDKDTPTIEFNINILNLSKRSKNIETSSNKQLLSHSNTPEVNSIIEVSDKNSEVEAHNNTKINETLTLLAECSYDKGPPELSPSVAQNTFALNLVKDALPNKSKHQEKSKSEITESNINIKNPNNDETENIDKTFQSITANSNIKDDVTSQSPCNTENQNNVEQNIEGSKSNPEEIQSDTLYLLRSSTPILLENDPKLMSATKRCEFTKTSRTYMTCEEYAEKLGKVHLNLQEENPTNEQNSNTVAEETYDETFENSDIGNLQIDESVEKSISNSDCQQVQCDKISFEEAKLNILEDSSKSAAIKCVSVESIPVRFLLEDKTVDASNSYQNVVTEAQNIEEHNDQSPLKEKEMQLQKTSEISEETSKTEESTMPSIDTVKQSNDTEEKKTEVDTHSGIKAINELLRHVSEQKCHAQPRVSPSNNTVKSNSIDINLKEDISVKNATSITDSVEYSSVNSDHSETTIPTILNVRSISPSIFNKLDNLNMDLIEKEEKISLDGNDILKITNELEEKLCLCCEQMSLVCCQGCLEAHYCSRRCASLHWNTDHYKHCTRRFDSTIYID